MSCSGLFPPHKAAVALVALRCSAFAVVLGDITDKVLIRGDKPIRPSRLQLAGYTGWFGTGAIPSRIHRLTV